MPEPTIFMVNNLHDADQSTAVEVSRQTARELAVALRLYEELYPDRSAGYAEVSAWIVNTYASQTSTT